jgi:hypothetical protein
MCGQPENRGTRVALDDRVGETMQQCPRLRRITVQINKPASGRCAHRQRHGACAENPISVGLSRQSEGCQTMPGDGARPDFAPVAVSSIAAAGYAEVARPPLSRSRTRPCPDRTLRESSPLTIS